MIKLTNNNLVLMDFYATWCGPCRLLAPVLETLSSVKIQKVNAENDMDLTRKYKIEAYPTVVLLKDGVEVDRRVGLHNRQQLQAMIDSHL